MLNNMSNCFFFRYPTGHEGIDFRDECVEYIQGAETSCVCVCTKRVCVSNTKPKASTVGIYST